MSVNEDICKLVNQAFEDVMKIDGNTVDHNVEVRGYDFSDAQVDYDKLFSAYKTTGFQATNLSLAMDEVNRMIDCKLKPVDLTNPATTEAARSYPKIVAKATDEEEKKLLAGIQDTNCTIYLGYTSNMISCGVRETIHFLVKNKMVDCIVTTCGGIEEDFMKCFKPTLMGAFELDGIDLRKKGLNRIGNMLVPNDTYRYFEDWFLNLIDTLLEEQKVFKSFFSFFFLLKYFKT
jgi:deoxyhypusine synthase